jgi:hypothetical protein
MVYTHRITGGLDVFHRPVFCGEETTFRQPDLFPSSGEGEDTNSVGSVRKLNLSHWSNSGSIHLYSGS